MATDRLINQTQGEDIIDQLQDIATKVGAITYGPQTTSDKVVAMTGYAKAATEAVISEGDTLNEAVGKLEKKADDALAGLDDKVVGPESSTTGAIATYSDATGNELANSGVTIATSTQGVTDSDTAVPTSKAVRAYNASIEHTYAFDTGTDNGTIKVTPSVGGTAGTAQSVAVKGLAGAAYKGVDTAPTASSANLVESGGVYTALGNKLDATANAVSAAKLNNGTSDYEVGSATKGVYFDDGIPKAMTYSVESNVPQNAVFTDTTYSNGTGITIGSGNAINHSNSVTAVTTAGAYKVKYDAQGHITGTATLSASDISAVPTSRTVNNKALSSNITLAGSDIALTGYSKASSASAVAATDTVNQAIGKLEKDLDGYVPTTRTINSKALSSNITLSASDVSAVPTTRTVNSKALSSNITLAGSDIALTGYSKGSSTAAVVATDTTNSAIAKHENRIDTNQTNILSVEDMVCATEFSSSTAYAVGDMVTYEHKLYKFINAHQGAWSASDVQNYDLTGDMSLVRPMNPYGQSVVSSGSLDNINKTETRVYNNPSGLPTGTSGYVICETTAADRQSATQTITFISGQSSTIFGQSYPKFFRSKISGTWRDWMIVDVNGYYCLVRANVSTSSATVDISSLPDGSYLLRCANSESATTRHGISLYTLLLNSTGTTMLFNPIVEVANAKISNLTRTGNTLNITFDHVGYHGVMLRTI